MKYDGLFGFNPCSAPPLTFSLIQFAFVCFRVHCCQIWPEQNSLIEEDDADLIVLSTPEECSKIKCFCRRIVSEDISTSGIEFSAYAVKVYETSKMPAKRGTTDSLPLLS